MFFSSSPPCTAVILAVIKIEKGDEGVAIGMYFRVLIVLGLQDDLSLIARDDVLGRKLQDIGLTNVDWRAFAATSSRSRSVFF